MTDWVNCFMRFLLAISKFKLLLYSLSCLNITNNNYTPKFDCVDTMSFIPKVIMKKKSWIIFKLKGNIHSSKFIRSNIITITVYLLCLLILPNTYWRHCMLERQVLILSVESCGGGTCSDKGLHQFHLNTETQHAIILILVFEALGKLLVTYR